MTKVRFDKAPRVARPHGLPRERRSWRRSGQAGARRPDAQFMRVGGAFFNNPRPRTGPSTMLERRLQMEKQTRKSGPTKVIRIEGNKATRAALARVRPILNRKLPGAASSLFDKVV